VRQPSGRLLTLVLAMLLVLCACESGGDQPATSAPESATTTTNPAQASSEQQALQAQMEADSQEAQGVVNGIEARVAAEPTLDGRLAVIITEYCRLGAGQNQTISGANYEVLRLLGQLYEKYWSAGGKWNRLINSAAAQQGACPASFKTPEPYGPVG
jgi:hypothetical protein